MIETNLSQWPLVVTTLGGVVTTTEVDEHLVTYERILRAGPYGARVVTGGALPSPPAEM